MMWHDWSNGWMMFGGGLLMLLFWGLALVGLIALVRWAMSRGDADGTPPGPDALEILRRRYAAGEIDEATYLRMKQELESGR